jgi:hypothetical protein
MAANTITRAEQIDLFVELHALALVLGNCRTYNGVDYLEEPRGLAVFDGPLFLKLEDDLDERADVVALELWPRDHDLDADPEYREASARACARVAEVLASLARAQEYFLDEAIRFAKMGTSAANQSSEGDDDA